MGGLKRDFRTKRNPCPHVWGQTREIKGTGDVQSSTLRVWGVAQGRTQSEGMGSPHSYHFHVYSLLPI